MHKQQPKVTPVESSRSRFVKNGLRAVRRSESYSFRRHSDEISPSEEMASVQMSKSTSYATPKDFWSDRYSVLAAPLGAEMYLTCERNIPETVLGAPRYYMDELTAGKDPNARPRFPYSNEAHQAAKTVTAQYKKNLRLRHEGAKAIQKAWRCHRTYQEYKPVYLVRAQAAARIHTEYKSSKRSLMASLRQRTELKRLSLLPKLKPPAMSEAEVERRYREKLAIRLTSFLRIIPKLLRKQRGRNRRKALHATRIQSLYRGNRARDRIWKMITAAIMIECVWRRFFKMKYTPYILKIQRTYLNHVLRGRVILIQKFARGFFHRRRAYKHKLKIASTERLRSTLERSLLKGVIQTAAMGFLKLHGLEMVRGKFRKWKRKMIARTVDPAPAAHIYHTLSENMLFFDPFEISALQNHVVNVKDMWPISPDREATDAMDLGDGMDRIGAVREKIASVFERYQYVQGKYLMDTNKSDPPIEEEDDERNSSKGGGRSTKSGKSGKTGSAKSPSKKSSTPVKTPVSGRSAKPGSGGGTRPNSTTGKFATGRSESPQRSVKSAKSSSETPPTSAKNPSGSSSKSPSKPSSAKSQSTTPNSKKSSVKGSSTKAVGSGKSSTRASASRKGYSAKGFMDHDDWAEGSIAVGGKMRPGESLAPIDYYNTQDKLIRVLIDSFTNWRYPRIDGFAMLICQEFMDRKLPPKVKVDGGSSLLSKLFACTLFPTLSLFPSRIYTEPEELSNISGVKSNPGAMSPARKGNSSRNIQAQTPLKDTDFGPSVRSVDSPSEQAIVPAAIADSNGVTRLGLDLPEYNDNEIDVMPEDNWGIMASSPRAGSSDNAFGWSPSKGSVKAIGFSEPPSPVNRSTSQKSIHPNVYDTTTPTVLVGLGNAEEGSTKLPTSVKSSSNKDSTTLVQFMGSKKQIPPESRKSGKLLTDSKTPSAKVAIAARSSKSATSSKTPLAKSPSKKSTKNMHNFGDSKGSTSMLANVSETARPSSKGKMPQSFGSSSKSRSAKNTLAATSSRKAVSTKNNKSTKSAAASIKKVPSIIISTEEVAAVRERVKFVLPVKIPQSPRPCKELPTGKFNLSMNLYKIWSPNELYSEYVPSRKVRNSVAIWGKFPDSLLAKAIFVRKWTVYFENELKIFLEKYRAHNPPRRFCPRCLMPSYVDIRQSHECSANSFPLGWISRDTWDPAVQLLVESCQALSDSKFDRHAWKQMGYKFEDS